MNKGNRGVETWSTIYVDRFRSGRTAIKGDVYAPRQRKHSGVATSVGAAVVITWKLRLENGKRMIQTPSWNLHHDKLRGGSTRGAFHADMRRDSLLLTRG